jgi:hypothetical protein
VPTGDMCEAFAHGHVADLCRSSNLEPQLWMLVNRLAHGSFAELADLATEDRSSTTKAADGWRRVEAELAHQLIGLAPRPADLRTLQQDVLWPLEEMLRTIEPLTGPCLAELHCLVASALTR